jgi:hypothetical protein
MRAYVNQEFKSTVGARIARPFFQADYSNSGEDCCNAKAKHDYWSD